MRLVAILLFLIVAACGTPQQRCINQSTNELRTVNNLITETEVNIARGYTYVTEARPVRVGFSYCTRGSHIGFCGSNYNDVVRRPVAIDLAAEERKLQDLKSRRASLTSAAAQTIEACQARYPQ